MVRVGECFCPIPDVILNWPESIEPCLCVALIDEDGLFAAIHDPMSIYSIEDGELLLWLCSQTRHNMVFGGIDLLDGGVVVLIKA